MQTSDWISFAIILGCGAIGGFLAWLYQLSTGVMSRQSAGRKAEKCITSVLFGAVAAATLNFVLRNDTNVLSRKDITLALLAGVFWKVVIGAFGQAIKNWLSTITLQETLVKADRSIEELQAAAKKGSSRLVEQKLVQVSTLMESIAIQLPNIQDSRMRAVARKSLDSGLDEINTVSGLHAPVSKEAETVIQAAKLKLPILSIIGGP